MVTPTVTTGPAATSVAGTAGYAAPAPTGDELVQAEHLPAPAPYQGTTYYGRPAVKPSSYGWRVAAYLWVGGLSGGAQVIATLGDLLDRDRSRGVVRRGRHVALAAAVAGPVLLIMDLHTPQRFFNMLRIFRPTSPMSIGTYVLSAFSLFSGLAALGQFLGDRAGAGQGAAGYTLARVTQVPAALAGAGMTTYTAALLGSTSTPLWSAAPCLLATRFAASSMATAAAALSLAAQCDGEDEKNVRALDNLTLAAGAVELTASLAADRRYRAKGVSGPLDSEPWGPVHKIGVQALGTAVPAALYAATRRSGRAPLLAAVGILAGGFLMRAAILHAGNRSAKRPRDYFRISQPGVLPENRHALAAAE
jgi:formate-dependent nitrite reductase membrane component NrfD